ncbi:MAG: 3-ketoacyl-ACP reductase, partial [Mesorhizobium sp.]
MTRPAAIITGGARGIGLACAEALADAGFDILVADLADKPADGLARNITARGAKFAYASCDIADLVAHAAPVETAMSAFGRIDCLVNNAGVGAVVRGDLLELKPENFDRALGINLRGTVFLSQAVAKAMLGTPGDHPKSIITITSISAEAASPERADYCVSKAGLSMWVKTLALRLAAEGIGVFEVRPGIIRTDMTSGDAAKHDALIEGGLV